MPSFGLLTAADCPLLAGDTGGDAAELLELANACAALFNDMANSEVRGVLDREDGRKLISRYEIIRDRLTRQHYRVGFLGTSSAGKSTIFNRVLQETVAESGSGQATTSLPSRLRRRDEGYRCDLLYMTTEQYKDRLKKLCLEVGIGSPPDSEDELLAMVSQLKPTVGGDDPTQRPIRQEDISYLRSFIDSYKAHRSKIRVGQPETRSVPFESRAAYINHSYTRGSGEIPDSLLLSEAHLLIPNKNLPDRLELCDLPGLNASRSVDTIVTRDFIRAHLDGALLFVNAAENLANAVVKDILLRLAERYGENLSGRAWVVFNKADTLTGPHYFPGSGQKSVFDNILDLLKSSKIPVSQVVFTSSRLIDRATNGSKPLDRGNAAELLGLTPETPVPNTLPDELIPVWEELLKDGGVSRLRRLILEEIARSVAAQIRHASKSDLARLREDITFLAEAERRRRSGGPQLRQKAVTCRNTVLRLREGLAGRATDFPVLAELRDHLRGKLAQLLCPDDRHAETLRTMNPAKLRQQFAVDALNLDETLTDVLTDEVVDRVYQKVGEHLEPLPSIPIGKYGGLGEAWQDFRRADRSDSTWTASLFPRFASDEALTGLGERGGYQHFDGDSYLGLMGEKVIVAVSQVIHGLRTRLRYRLGELEAELDRLLAPDGQPKP